MDKNGDLVLEMIGSEESAYFLVDSKTLIEASSVFANMLGANSPFLESQIPLRHGYPGVLQLKDSDEIEVEGMFFVLRVVYATDRSKLAPKSINELYAAAVVVDKYDFISVLDHAQGWLKKWNFRRSPVGLDAPKWIFVAWTLGYPKQFEAAAKWILLNSVLWEGEILVVVDASEDGAEVEGERLPDVIPAAVEEQLQTTQQEYFKLLDEHLTQIRQTFTEIRKAQRPLASKEKEFCYHKYEGYDDPLGKYASVCSTLIGLPSNFIIPVCPSRASIRSHMDSMRRALKNYPTYLFGASITSRKVVAKLRHRDKNGCVWIREFLQRHKHFDQDLCQGTVVDAGGKMQRKVEFWSFLSRQRRFPERYLQQVLEVAKGEDSDEDMSWS
ncbi:hypothetical protein BJ508DRAFT_363645 [Ascobolus immersus RN42]|uniref:BTB domain-containing protein n=1 Tax=Ascobolus immersus RN42 TaxID=1160509 RepID=A0A3N4I3L9_ASCIM|nr:hypothetical protein BJ508DRAFT_363645 [Ascobolus immersus RN42]